MGWVTGSRKVDTCQGQAERLQQGCAEQLVEQRRDSVCGEKIISWDKCYRKQSNSVSVVYLDSQMAKSRCPAHDTEHAGSSPARQQGKEGGRDDNSKQHTVAGLINKSEHHADAES